MTLEVTVEKRLGSLGLSVAFSSPRGITVLFGRSGAGKTSVLNAVAGLLRPERGRIALDGETLYDSAAGVDLPAHRRRIGYVFQEARLLPHLRVRGNLLFGARFARGPAVAEFAQVIDLLGLDALLDRRPHDLSGGERQRVALGRALLSAPRLLLMDEPLASLDAPRKEEVMRCIERLRGALRLPILYVSHSMDEVVRLADTLVIMAEGRVITAGALGDTMARLPFDAKFDAHLGHFEAGSVIDARIAEHDAAMGLARLEFGGGSLYASGVAGSIGQRVRVHVLSRDVALARTRPEFISMLNILPGTIRRIGSPHDAGVDLEIDVRGTPLIARITVKSRVDLALAPGDSVHALIKGVAIHPAGAGQPD